MKNIRALIFDVLFLFLFFFDAITMKVPYGNYWDEAITILAFIFLFLRFLKKKRTDKSHFYLLILSVITISIGIVSNYLYGYVDDLSIIFRDIVGLFKFYICFVAADRWFENRKSYESNSIVRISKFLIVFIFLFGLISLFVDIGMGDSVRFGIRSFKFVFSFYNVLVFNEMILLAVLMVSREKSNMIYYIFSFLTLALTLRTKAVFVVVVFLFFKILQKHQPNLSSKCNYIKLAKYGIPLGAIIGITVKDKVKAYISWGKYNSIRIGALFTGLDIAKDHFPLGSGFGTYGTDLSYNTGSQLYEIYNAINYESMMDPNQGYATMADTYWPAIYSQCGFIGFLFYAICMILCFRIVRKHKFSSEANKISCMYILTCMFFISLTEAVYINTTGVTGAILIAIILNMKYGSSKVVKGHHLDVVTQNVFKHNER